MLFSSLNLNYKAFNDVTCEMVVKIFLFLNKVQKFLSEFNFFTCILIFLCLSCFCNNKFQKLFNRLKKLKFLHCKKIYYVVKEMLKQFKSFCLFFCNDSLKICNFFMLQFIISSSNNSQLKKNVYVDFNTFLWVCFKLLTTLFVFFASNFILVLYIIILYLDVVIFFINC